MFSPSMENRTTKDASVGPPLALVLDIDGTLIAEGRHIHHIFIRPGVVDFLRRCKEKGYALAIWTSASSAWAFAVSRKLCKLIHGEHSCSGHQCGQTFDFVWTGERKRQRSQLPISEDHYDENDACKWCGPYRYSCRECSCWQYLYSCPCRFTKDLQKVWSSEEPETAKFTKHRTLIVENTPQKCIHNYGNAIYVPTYSSPEDERTKKVFEKLGSYLENELENAPSVREVQKCAHGSKPHACYEQTWWD